MCVRIQRGLMDRVVSDEQLMRMLREVEDVEAHVDEALSDALDAPDAPLEPIGDACGFCGEPAQYTGECHCCGDEGCLPPDLWSPGMRDPCLTLCVRCARSIHLACAAHDEAGNPRCPTCKY